ncbi:MAG: NADH-quinone oxidoreductase subunit NuoN [Burkholderiaceae bacterium]|jgi:NADH-quinone oxidoreductase subunit N
MIDKLSWVAAYPEILLLVMTCVIAMADLGVKSVKRSSTYIITLLTLAALSIINAAYAMNGETIIAFGGMVISDPMGHWLKSFASLAMFITLIYGRDYAFDRGMLRGGELFTLSLFALLGMYIMMSGHHFVVLYLGLELLTLSSYALVALRRDNANASEAAMKYFVLGAMASGFMLYGLSMMYGATGSLDVAVVSQQLTTGAADSRVLALGVVFVVAGLAFKLGAAPFHMWVPDVYDGAPTAVTLMIAGAPKLAAFAIVMRLLVEGMLPMALDWQQMLGILAVASLLVGNLAAIAQTNVKRMLAFSTIAQMGFVLLGMVAGVNDGTASNALNAYSATMFYMVTYVLTTLATFGVILLLNQSNFEVEKLSDLAGLNQRSPMMAGVLAASMFSLAGVPPMVGFYAKLSVLQALLESNEAAYIYLGIFAVLMSLVGAFYYLRIVKLMYFDAPSSSQTAMGIHAPAEAKLVLGLNGFSLLVFGLVPSGLMVLCAQAITELLV